MIGVRFVMVALLVLVACKKKGPDESEIRIAKLNDFANQMCSCKAHDKACADRVQAAMNASLDRADPPRDEATMQKITEIGRRYDECWALAMAAAPGAIKPAEPLPRPVEPPPPPPKLTLTSVTSENADELFRHARDYAAQERPDLHLVRVTYDYVDAEALLDPTHGDVDVAYGILPPTKKRRLGTPVDEGTCVRFTTHKGSWLAVPRECSQTIEYLPRCTVAAIWKRALAKKAPAEAVARIELDVPAKSWTFRIDDEPAKVHIKHSFADDCELAVESP